MYVFEDKLTKFKSDFDLCDLDLICRSIIRDGGSGGILFFRAIGILRNGTEPSSGLPAGN